MTIDEWHTHFEKVMTQLCEARDRLKAARLGGEEFHRVREEVRALMHELDCLTNPALTPIDPEPLNDTGRNQGSQSSNPREAGERFGQCEPEGAG